MYRIPILTLLTFQKSCLKIITEKDFSTDQNLAIVAENFSDIYIPEVPVTINFENSESKNFIFYLNKPKFIENLDPQGKYVFVTENTTNVLQIVEENKLKKFLVVKNNKIWYPQNSKTCTNLKLQKSENCVYPDHIFKPNKHFDSDCVVKLGYIETPPFVNNVKHPEKPGIMVSWVNLISEISGFKLEYQDSKMYQHELLNNGTLFDISKALENGTIDIAIGQLAMNDTKTAPFDYGPIIYSDCYHLTAPKPKKLKSYRKLFIVFNLELWKRIFTGVLVMILVFYIFSLCENYEKTHFFNVMFDVFTITIGGGVSHLPNWLSFRILLSFFLLFCLSMDNIYLGNLSNIFAQSSYDIPVNNFAAAAATRIVAYVDWRSERVLLLKFVTAPYKTKQKRLFITNHTQFYLMNHTALRKENGTMLFLSLLETYPSEESLLFHFRITTDYLTFLVTFYIRQKLQFREALDFWAQEIIERGFLVKWFSDIRRSNIRPEILPEDEKKLVVLKLAHFEESFRVLLGGYALGLAALVLEFVFLKLEKIGVVDKVRKNVMFVVALLKPPERVFKERIE